MTSLKEDWRRCKRFIEVEGPVGHRCSRRKVEGGGSDRNIRRRNSLYAQPVVAAAAARGQALGPG